MAPTWQEWYVSLQEVPMLYRYALFYFVRLLWRRLKEDPMSIFPLRKLGEQSFGEAWLALGSEPRQGDRAPGVPLFATAKGVVLDLGPGSGVQMRFLSNKNITAMYGAEPVEILHPALQQQAITFGMEKRYHILPCGGQPDSLRPALVKAGVLDHESDGEVFDTIVSSKVLCTIPHQKETIASLYNLLKPGGRLLLVEHVKSPWRQPKGSIIARLEQIFFTMIGWPYVMGGCKLNCDTVAALKAEGEKHGGWEIQELEYLAPWSPIPFVVGSLTKRS